MLAPPKHTLTPLTPTRTLHNTCTNLLDQRNERRDELKKKRSKYRKLNKSVCVCLIGDTCGMTSFKGERRLMQVPTLGVHNLISFFLQSLSQLQSGERWMDKSSLLLLLPQLEFWSWANFFRPAIDKGKVLLDEKSLATCALPFKSIRPMLTSFLPIWIAMEINELGTYNFN